MDNFYYELPTKSIIATELMDVVNNGGGWVPHKSFLAKQVDHRTALKDPLFQKLAEKFQFVVSILRMEPWTTYNWHIDDERTCGINMLLTDGPSHCLFNLRTDQGSSVSQVAELNYEPDTYYLFNTNMFHMVINLDKPRYLMSVQFCDHTNYQELLSFFKGV